MKTTIHIIALLFIATTMMAQSNVTIKINHFLSGETYENGKVVSNDLEQSFMIDRLEYYLSGFSIVHDGGQVTPIDDIYVLVSLAESSEPTAIDLGDHDINELEAVKFHFGIDEAANHSDPAAYHASHALAPKFPSMHWGWAAGYRFIALEGKSGPSVDQEMQFHCIGDEFYSEMGFPVSMSELDTYEVNIDAEYTELLSEIDIDSGLILHGGLGEIVKLARNIGNRVFNVSSVTSTKDDESIISFNVFPNPTRDVLNIDLESLTENNMLRIYDATGRLVSQKHQADNMSVVLDTKGVYFISIVNEKGEVLASRKAIVD